MSSDGAKLSSLAQNMMNVQCCSVCVFLCDCLTAGGEHEYMHMYVDVAGQYNVLIYFILSTICRVSVDSVSIIWSLNLSLVHLSSLFIMSDVLTEMSVWSEWVFTLVDVLQVLWWQLYSALWGWEVNCVLCWPAETSKHHLKRAAGETNTDTTHLHVLDRLKNVLWKVHYFGP